MLILKYNAFLKGNARLVCDFSVVVDTLLWPKRRLWGDQPAVVAMYLARNDALSPNICINIGELNSQIF
jgi:hypothetical protein